MAPRFKDYAERIASFAHASSSATSLAPEDERLFISKETSDTTSETSDEPIFTRKGASTRIFSRFNIITGVVGTLSVGLLILILVLAQQKHTSTDIVEFKPFQGGSHVVEHCGKTSEEAIANGCIWDLMSFGWTHPKCYNKAESDAWIEQYGPWKWYRDRNATQPLTDEQLPYERVVYTEQGYHVVHCIYIFKLLHLAGMSGQLVTDEAIPLAHTDHCVKLIASPKYTDFKHINTKVDLLLARCVTLD